MTNHLVTTAAKFRSLMDHLENAPVCGFDTESIGPQLRGRRKDQSFINIYRSTMIGCSFAFDDGAAFYIPIHHTGKDNIKYDKLLKVLTALSRSPRVWGHNIKHDHNVLKLGSFPSPKNEYLDSSLAAWLVRGENQGNSLKVLASAVLERTSPEFSTTLWSCSPKEALRYTCEDAINTLELGVHMSLRLGTGLWDWFTTIECPTALILADMQRNGMGIDTAKLSSLQEEVQEKIDETKTEWSRLFPEISIASPAQLQGLFSLGYWPETFPTDSKKGWKTDRESLELIISRTSGEAQYAAQLKRQYQDCAKILSTYTHTLIDDAQQYPDGRLHPDYNQLGTKTGRLSSAHPNAQNIPVRTDLGQKVKACFVPRDGYEYLGADESQVELRILAHYCGGLLRDTYLKGADLHQQTADILGCDRFHGKTVNFALVYGASAYKVGKILGISTREAAPKAKALRDGYVGLDKFHSDVKQVLWSRSQPHVRMISGRHSNVHLGEAGTPEQREARAERQAVNKVVQGSGADVIKAALVKFFQKTDSSEKVLPVNCLHDEITLEVPIGKGKELAPLLQDAMENPGIPLSVPLVAEPKVGMNWLELK